jgi:hypothetical protein
MSVLECFKSFMTLLKCELVTWPKLTSALKCVD